MLEETLTAIQQQIIQLLPPDHRNAPGILLADSCSEVARLVAGWIQKLDATSNIFIIKGTNVCGTKKAHDMIAVMPADNTVYIVDPTIWQFFPKAESIIVCVVPTLNATLINIQKMYGGQWERYKQFVQLDENAEQQYRTIISENIRQNLAITN